MSLGQEQTKLQKDPLAIEPVAEEQIDLCKLFDPNTIAQVG